MPLDLQQQRKQYRAPFKVQFVEWNPCSDLLALASRKGEVMVKRNVWKRCWKCTKPGCVVSMTWSPDGAVLAVAMDNGLLHLIEAEQGVVRFGETTHAQRMRWFWSAGAPPPKLKLKSVSLMEEETKAVASIFGNGDVVDERLGKSLLYELLYLKTLRRTILFLIRDDLVVLALAGGILPISEIRLVDKLGALPYAFSSNECCDGTLRNIMLNAASRSIATPHLGDAAKAVLIARICRKFPAEQFCIVEEQPGKTVCCSVEIYRLRFQYIQRRIQLQYGQSYEVIISRENFAVSTHYHGASSCKIRSGSYYFLAYSTPVQYDPFNIAQEDLLASTDSEEPLGCKQRGTPIFAVIFPMSELNQLLEVGVRFAFQRPHFIISLADDLSIQPSPEQARAAIFEGAGGPARTARQRRPISMDTEEDTGDERTLTVIDGFHVGGNRSLGHVTSRDEQDFPPGSHCDRDNRSGNMCCDSKLFQTITDAFYDLSSSPQFAFGRAGNIASLIQKRIQQRFSQSFEVFVSSDDFAMASYYKGDQICKYQERGFTVMAYATTVQYDTTNTAAESFYSSISYRDPLGATEPSLPGMRAPHTPLALYGEGGRAGFPVGSHCGESRAASRKQTLVRLKGLKIGSSVHETSCPPKNTDRTHFSELKAKKTIQWNAEEMLGMSLEVVISSDDFAFSTSYGGDAVCKYRIDRYHIMAYASPVQYPIHTDFYEDSGPAEPLNCPSDLKALSGAVCCDGILQYEMTRLIDQTVANQPADQRDQQSIARAIQRNIQRRFGTTFESIAAKSDFVWSTNLYNENTCKLNAGGYHLLTVESSKEPPPIEDFIDAIPPMPFNAEPSFQPEALPPPQLFQPPPVQAPPQAVAQPPVAPQAAPAPFAAPPAAAPAFAPKTIYPGGCFSTDTWVTTPNGKKRMDQLKVGDFILTANSTAAYFAPMSLWIHREPDVVMKFVTIMTDYGKMLALTPRHLIFRTDCEEYYDDRVDNLPPNSQAVYAEELHVGDCVFLLYKNKFRLQKLMDISITSRRGVFSPLTPNGRIIVNDMLASCYSDVNEATLQTTYFSVRPILWTLNGNCS
ncbi:unnamed protein product [Nippostrongylus brasiliensis]|uniref:Protein RIC1 homolog n=1 Tax=Nippostrongylus brasiliensis TaxID=27835 RepID=A0A158QWP4_NIPBR|nr:unnamed protein product [Nippostrongylus brasiliensis]